MDIENLSHIELVALVRTMRAGGIAVMFDGKSNVHEIVRKVRPRQMRLVKKLCAGSAADQAQNMIIEGENLQAMSTLYRYRGSVDMIITDPPYNTGRQFRYNDKWDSDPNDPDLGAVVTSEDGSRHTKWMKAILPRLYMMKAMLKPTGVICVCIDHNELYHLGMMMDEVFSEENRLGIINWQKTTSKNGLKHVANTTEYVLVYAKSRDVAETLKLDRSEKSNRKFANPDNDELGDWKQGDLTGKGRTNTGSFSLQSPFTGEFHDPGTRHWAQKRAEMKRLLEEWGVEYEDFSLAAGDRALALKGWTAAKAKADRAAIVESARQVADKRLVAGNWPVLYWGLDGRQKPVKKIHRIAVAGGAVPMSFWVDEDEDVFDIGSQSWTARLSGRTRDGVEELDKVVGKGHGFDTVKPLRLIKKLLQIWCPPNGLVLDPYAGSGAVGHAVLELNDEQETERRFILIEQGSPEKGDKYARCLTRSRLANAIDGISFDKHGIRLFGPKVSGGFSFYTLKKEIDAKAVLSMEREELIDVIIASHWELERRGTPSLVRMHGDFEFLVGKNHRNEGCFIIWHQGSVGAFGKAEFAKVKREAEKAGISSPFHVYARYEDFAIPSVKFWKVPEHILGNLGMEI